MNTNNKYILEVSRGYPSPKYKTHGVFEWDQTKALVEAGQKVIFMSIDMRSIRRVRSWGYNNFEKDGVSIYEMNIPLGRVPKCILYYVQKLSAIFLYNKIVEDCGKPSIIHAHFFDIGYVASKLKQKYQIPLVITEHASQINKVDIDKKIKKVAFDAYHNADLLIAVSNTLAEKIYNNFNINSMIIPNIVDTHMFRVRNNCKYTRYTFISVGRLVKGKGFKILIHAFSELIKENIPANLIIYGEGDNREELQIIINKLGLNNCVNLKGNVEREELAEELTKSNCFVLASERETFGVAYIEALASGIPLITTDNGGVDDFINKNNAIKVGVNNKEELMNAMKHMYYNSDNYNAQLISSEIKAKFSTNIIANKLISEFKNILR